MKFNLKLGARLVPPALIQRQIPAEDGEPRVGASTVVNTRVPQVNQHVKNMLCCLVWISVFGCVTERSGNLTQLFIFYFFFYFSLSITLEGQTVIN